MENKLCYVQEEHKNFLSMCTPVFDALHSHEMEGRHGLIQQVHPVLTYDLSQPSNFCRIFERNSDLKKVGNEKRRKLSDFQYMLQH